jgi:hypothetical protein
MSDARPMTEAQLRKRIRTACEGAQKAGLQVWGVEVGEGGSIRLVTAPEGVDRPSQTMPNRQPDALDRWATDNVVSIEAR